MKRKTLLSIASRLKDTPLAKRLVNIMRQKTVRVAELSTHVNIEELNLALPLILDNEELMEKLRDDYGTCTYYRCDNVGVGYQGPSGDTYCSSDCAWENSDGWDNCARCNKQFDYVNGYNVGETYCSKKCALDDMLESDSYPEIGEFYSQYPEFDKKALYVQKVDVWELSENPTHYLKEFYGVLE